jgi:hypothetical protein
MVRELLNGSVQIWQQHKQRFLMTSKSKLHLWREFNICSTKVCTVIINTICFTSSNFKLPYKLNLIEWHRHGAHSIFPQLNRISKSVYQNAIQIKCIIYSITLSSRLLIQKWYHHNLVSISMELLWKAVQNRWLLNPFSQQSMCKRKFSCATTIPFL